MITGNPCSCGGNNENCYRCDGTGFYGATEPVVKDGVFLHNRPLSTGSSTHKRKARNIPCPVCGKMFAWKAGVFAHIKAVHDVGFEPNPPIMGSAFSSNQVATASMLYGSPLQSRQDKLQKSLTANPKQPSNIQKTYEKVSVNSSWKAREDKDYEWLAEWLAKNPSQFCSREDKDYEWLAAQQLREKTAPDRGVTKNLPIQKSSKDLHTQKAKRQIQQKQTKSSNASSGSSSQKPAAPASVGTNLCVPNRNIKESQYDATFSYAKHYREEGSRYGSHPSHDGYGDEDFA